MTISVLGIGWLTGTGYGCIAKGVDQVLPPGEGALSQARKSIFELPFKNFGRLDGMSRLTCCAVALAFKDAGVDYAPSGRLDAGIIGGGRAGSLQSDIDYFRDYLDNGRTLARGNLFIYTLPSSPLGEAAIHFGLTGPLLYVCGGANTLSSVVAMAAGAISSGETDRMLAGWADGGEALYLMLGINNEGTAPWTLEDTMEILDTELDITKIRNRFLHRRGIA